MTKQELYLYIAWLGVLGVTTFVVLEIAIRL